MLYVLSLHDWKKRIESASLRELVISLYLFLSFARRKNGLFIQLLISHLIEERRSRYLTVLGMWLYLSATSALSAIATMPNLLRLRDCVFLCLIGLAVAQPQVQLGETTITGSSSVSGQEFFGGQLFSRLKETMTEYLLIRHTVCRTSYRSSTFCGPGT